MTMTKFASILVPLALLAACTSGTSGNSVNSAISGASASASASGSQASTSPAPSSQAPSSQAPGSQTPSSQAPAEPAPALAAALARVPAAALGSSGDFEFGDTAKLTAATVADRAKWQQVEFEGAGSLAAIEDLLKPTVGVDLAAASSVLSVGPPPASMTLVIGGQDQAAVQAAATRSGWTGTDVLTKQLDLAGSSQDVAQVSISVRKIRPLKSDVVLGGASSDPASVDTGPAADQMPALVALRSCLQAVVAAQAVGTNTTSMTAVGTRVDGTTSTTVICLGAPDATAAKVLTDKVKSQLASGASSRTQQRWSVMLPGTTVDILPGPTSFVRITTASTAVRPSKAYQMLLADDLPD